VGFAGHITIGDNVRIKAKSGISKNVKDGEILQGPVAFNDTNYSKSYIHFKNLPKIISEIEELKKEILNLKMKHNG
jgi:UDP-3-O-[3-hydroxymyristoyl] glucosamine N-acyltransferase